MCWVSRANNWFEREPQLQTRCQVHLHLGTMFRSLKAGKLRSAVGVASKSEISAARPMKLVVGWRFAPACCAAQSVSRRGPLSTLHLKARQGPLNQAVPVGKISAFVQQKRNSSTFAPSKCSSLKAHAVPPNHSVNRTHCGGPSFGL